MSDTVLKIEGLNKKFTKSIKRSMYYGTVDALKSMVSIFPNDNDLRKSEFWALQNINFELKRGENLGLIGQNGCGKTTLLRLINGIFPPDKGKITISGRIGALIAVGAGFHPHMTGRENIYLNGTILGISKKELDSKLDKIIDFAEIGEFIDAPVATYSSGMTVRLGFSIAIHGHVDIMLVDEILAVGDLTFQLKCQKKLSEFSREGGSFIIVSHSIQLIRNTCQRVLWLDRGNVIDNGEVFKICANYENHSLSSRLKYIETKTDENLVLNYDKNIHFNVSIVNENNIECKSIYCGEQLEIKINYNVRRLVKKPIFTISAIGENGIVIFEYYLMNQIESLQNNGEIYFVIPDFAVKPQLYYISVTLSELDILNKLEWHNNLYSILVLSDKEIKINQGCVFFKSKWTHNN